jgi:hypothetical protein
MVNVPLRELEYNAYSRFSSNWMLVEAGKSQEERPFTICLFNEPKAGSTDHARSRFHPANMPAIFLRHKHPIGAMMVNRTAPLLARPRFFQRTRRHLGPERLSGRWSMTIVPVMWIVWGVLVVLLAALYVYRTSLTRDEEDQVFLDDSFDHERSAQEAIVAKVNKLEPFVRIALWLVAASTLFVIGYYIWDIFTQFK